MLTSLDYPDMEERISQIKSFISQYRGKYTIEWNNEDIRMAATLLRGFSEIQIENILSTALVSQSRLGREDLYGLTSQKSRLYSAVSSIQMVKVDRNLTVSGLDALKEWLNSKRAYSSLQMKTYNSEISQHRKAFFLPEYQDAANHCPQNGC